MSYALGPVKPWVKDAALKLGPMFGIASIGGYRVGARDMTGHPAGRALDFMTNSKTQGDQLAAYAQANAAALNVEYIIWWQKIWSVERSSEGWRAMEDRGDPTQNHFDHVHVNFNATAGQGGVLTGAPTTPTITNAGLDLGGIGDAISGTTKIVTWWLEPNNVLRAAAFVAGIILLLIAINRIGNIQSNVASGATNLVKEVIS